MSYNLTKRHTKNTNAGAVPNGQNRVSVIEAAADAANSNTSVDENLPAEGIQNSELNADNIAKLHTPDECDDVAKIAVDETNYAGISNQISTAETMEQTDENLSQISIDSNSLSEANIATTENSEPGVSQELIVVTVQQGFLDENKYGDASHDIGTYISKVDSYDEAIKKASVVDSAINEHGGVSDKLILALFIFMGGNGLNVLKYKNWKAYFDDRLAESCCTESTLYHYVEIADLALQNKIVPLDAAVKSLRAACKPKAAIRQEIWDEGKIRSGLDVPPVGVIKEIHAEYKNVKNDKIQTFFSKLTDGKSQNDIRKAYRKIVARIECIKDDELEVEELDEPTLQKLKSSFQSFMIENDVSLDEGGNNH